MPTENVWNSLEVVKLFISLLTPVVVVVLGYLFNRRLKEVERKSQPLNRCGCAAKDLLHHQDFGELSLSCRLGAVP